MFYPFLFYPGDVPNSGSSSLGGGGGGGVAGLMDIVTARGLPQLTLR